MAVREEIAGLTQRQREGRAVNAVAELLRRTLSVPNIYLEPPASVIRADVLAVDRGGAGDLHAVEIKLAHDLNPKYREKIGEIHRQLMATASHYRYLAIPTDCFELAFDELAHLGLFPADGIGRLGVITISEKSGDPPVAEMKITAERFRVDPAKLKAIETKVLAKSRPDIEVRI